MLAPSRLRLNLVPALLVLACLGACSSGAAPSRSWLDVVSPYRFDRVQGNVVTREQVAALRPGMSRAAVRDILGTPLLTSVFHAARWDYVFSLRRQGAEAQSRHVTVFFRGDEFDHVDADELPSEAEFVATLKSMPNLERLPALEASEESLKKFPPATPAPAAPAPSAARAPSDYPPLEPAAR